MRCQAPLFSTTTAALGGNLAGDPGSPPSEATDKGSRSSIFHSQTSLVPAGARRHRQTRVGRRRFSDWRYSAQRGRGGRANGAAVGSPASTRLASGRDHHANIAVSPFRAIRAPSTPPIVDALAAAMESPATDPLGYRRSERDRHHAERYGPALVVRLKKPGACEAFRREGGSALATPRRPCPALSDPSAASVQIRADHGLDDVSGAIDASRMPVAAPSRGAPALDPAASAGTALIGRVCPESSRGRAHSRRQLRNKVETDQALVDASDLGQIKSLVPRG